MSLRGKITSKASTPVKLGSKDGNRERNRERDRGHHQQQQQQTSRRCVLTGTILLGELVTASTCWKESAKAFDLPDFAKLVGRKPSKPGAIRFPRAKVDDKLAVACMRRSVEMHLFFFFFQNEPKRATVQREGDIYIFFFKLTLVRILF